MNAEALKKMSAGRIGLVLDNPFFGVLAMGLNFKEDPSCKTAWVDGRRLGYNPTFVLGLSHDEIVGLIGHEVEHVALGHPWRRGGRDQKDWNVACDKAINHDLREAGFKLPPDAYYSEGEEQGKSAEWIYAHTEKPAPQPKPEPQPEPDGEQEPNGPGDSPVSGQGDEESDDDEEPSEEPGTGDAGEGEGDDEGTQGTDDPLGEVRDAPTGPDETGEPAPTEDDWKQRVAAAATAAKAQGKLPGGLERSVQDALKPKVDTRSLLLRFFQERANADYTWTQPNSRYVPHGLYLPALKSNSLGRVAIMIDTSGSVDDEALALARGIVESVMEESKPAGFDLVFADAEVKRVERHEAGDPLTWEPQGGGGTDFCPALQHIEDEGEAVCIICITDLEGTFPDAEPSIPVLWLATEDHIAPFGETVPVQF